MNIVVTSNGADLDGSSSHNFGRCPMFLFVETESMKCEATANPAAEAPSGAGIEAARFVVDSGVEAVITGRVGPKAMHVLEAAGLPVYLFGEGTARQAVEAFKAKALERATGEAGGGRGQGGGRGRGQGGGRGRGQGGGRGRGQGGGRGRR
jgi:predicted Fe-Mo cluster-binding NifX family protein